MAGAEAIVVGVRPQVHLNAEVLHIVDGLAGAGQHLAEQTAIDGGVGEVIHMSEQGVQRDPLALFFLDPGLAGGGAAAHREVGAVGVGGTLQHDDLLACAAEVQRGHQAGSTGTGDDDIGVIGHGGLAQSLIGLLFLHRDLHRLALGLCDTGISSGFDGLGGDGGTADVVHLSTLCSKDGVGKVVTLCAADVGGLLGDVHLDVGDAVGIKGHGDGHGAHAGGSGTVGAGDVSAGGGRGSGGAVGGLAAGGQTQSSSTQSAHSGTLEEFAAGNVAHDSFSFSLFDSIRSIDMLFTNTILNLHVT